MTCISKKAAVQGQSLGTLTEHEVTARQETNVNRYAQTESYQSDRTGSRSVHCQQHRSILCLPCAFYISREAKCIVVTTICLSVCPSPHSQPLHGPGCKLEEWQGVPFSCALLGGFAIGARVSLLWQHSDEREMSASACTRCMPGFIIVVIFWSTFCEFILYMYASVSMVLVALCELLADCIKCPFVLSVHKMQFMLQVTFKCAILLLCSCALHSVLFISV